MELNSVVKNQLQFRWGLFAPPEPLIMRHDEAQRCRNKIWYGAVRQCGSRLG